MNERMNAFTIVGQRWARLRSSSAGPPSVGALPRYFGGSVRT